MNHLWDDEDITPSQKQKIKFGEESQGTPKITTGFKREEHAEGKKIFGQSRAKIRNKPEQNQAKSEIQADLKLNRNRDLDSDKDQETKIAESINSQQSYNP